MKEGMNMENFNLHDQHVHSHYSKDSEQPLIPYIENAIAKKCRYFITTDHLDLDSPFSLEGDWDIDFEQYIREITDLQRQYPQIKILKGIELGYRNCNYQTIAKRFENIAMDLINLSVHYNDFIDYYQPYYFEKYGLDKTLKIYFDNILEAITNYNDFQVLSHIDYGFKTAYLYDKTTKIENYQEQLQKIFEVLIHKNKALEINTKVQSIFPIEHTDYLLKLYFQMGGRKLTLSSDAHQLKFYQNLFDKYQLLIKNNGFHYLCYFIQQKEYHYSLDD